jgi:hypothetical protein
MAQPYENNPIHGAVELLKTNGFDALDGSDQLGDGR